ncbi:MAG: tRNA (N(6)-L-threonylcarbamoyladenosine(37)-C(2))-methylthiotransferase MtaB, partial [Clostridia bacterium]|nr:tRNA (N(6)-L-threonylcarbamoyladenosine(37)-C(2))-methylthiotransferase MtaB [Clostridia bacterium]
MTIKFYTLGCKVNQYDTMALSELFKKRGYSMAKKCDIPDVMVINSCTVTAESDRKTRQAVNRFRKKYPEAVIVVTGCMTQAVKEKGEKLVNADVVIGNALNEQLPDFVDEYIKNKERIIRWKEH